MPSSNSAPVPAPPSERHPHSQRRNILAAVAWPYANGPRHIGHVSGFGVPSDVFSRYQRMAGNRVLMVSGTDEHGTVPVGRRRDGEAFGGDHPTNRQPPRTTQPPTLSPAGIL